MKKPVVIRVENISKQYRLGAISHDTLKGDLQRWWARKRGKTDPNLKIDRQEVLSEGNEFFWALKDISFDVKQGEVLGIIGKNGAGKSTLLKILSRVTTPTRGAIKVRGRVASLLEVGTGFHPELTGRENIFLNGAILGMGKAEIRSKLDAIVAFAEMGRFIDTPVKRYSSGMYVRLAFAVAAHLEPEILVVDEVLAVGDAGFQKKCLGKMSDVAKGGRTVLFVSHNMTAVKNLCTSVLSLTQGVLTDKGGPEKVIETYLLGSDGSRDVQVEPGVFKFARRKNPCTDAPPMIMGMKLLSQEGVSQDRFPMGGEMRIVLELSRLSTYRDAVVGITIKSGYGQWLCSLNSGMACEFLDISRAEEEFAVLRIPRIPLTPGRYIIDVQAAQKGIGMIDEIEDAGRFHVFETDIYGTGYQLTSFYGVFYLDAKWVVTNRVNGRGRDLLSSLA